MPQNLLPSTRGKVQRESNFTQPAAEPGKGIGVDLLGRDARETAPPSFVRWCVTVGGSALLAIVLFAVWRQTLLARETEVLGRIAEVELVVAKERTFLSGVSEERKAIDARVKDMERVRVLLSRHLYWTRFFRFLEATTIPDVYYTNLSVDPKGAIRLAAVGRDFAAVARQLRALEESEDVERVRITKAAQEMGGATPGVQFDIEIAVKQTLLFGS